MIRTYKAVFIDSSRALDDPRREIVYTHFSEAARDAFVESIHDIYDRNPHYHHLYVGVIYE